MLFVDATEEIEVSAMLCAHMPRRNKRWTLDSSLHQCLEAEKVDFGWAFAFGMRGTGRKNIAGITTVCWKNGGAVQSCYS